MRFGTKSHTAFDLGGQVHGRPPAPPPPPAPAPPAVMCMEMLHFRSQVRPIASFADEISLPTVHKEELRLATKLIESWTREKFDLAQYQDEYTNRVK
jgi:hypothetical protein